MILIVISLFLSLSSPVVVERCSSLSRVLPNQFLFLSSSLSCNASDRTFLFYTFDKSGGTSAYDSMQQLRSTLWKPVHRVTYQDRILYDRNGGMHLGRFRAFTQVVAGMMDLPVFRSTHFVTAILLREPVSRAISEYFFRQQHSKHSRLLGLHPNESLMEHSVTFSNFVTKRLSSAVQTCAKTHHASKVDYFLCIENQPRALLEETCDHVLEHFETLFSVVLILEDIPKSTALLAQLLDIPDFRLPQSNRGYMHQAVSQETMQQLAEINDLDMRIYSRALAIFHRQQLPLENHRL